MRSYFLQSKYKHGETNARKQKQRKLEYSFRLIIHLEVFVTDILYCFCVNTKRRANNPRKCRWGLLPFV